LESAVKGRKVFAMRPEAEKLVKEIGG